MDPATVGRVEDHRFITGQGRFVANLVPADALVAHLVRSPHANGRIRRIDVTAAHNVPGVALVLTGADLDAEGIGPIPCILPVPFHDGRPMAEPARKALVTDFVRHVGDPVALIVADRLETCLDAAERVDLDIEPLPAVVELRGAVQEGAPQIHAQAPGNLAFDWRVGDRAAVDAAFASASQVVQIDLVNPRVAVSPIETRGLFARYDAATGRFHVVTTSQGVHDQRNVLAKVMGLEPEQLHIVTPDVGGGFGIKIMVYPEQVACLAAARRLGRAIAWQGSRSEAFVSDHHGRDHATTARLALDNDGRFLALDVDTLGNLGAYAAMTAPFMPTEVYRTMMGGCYALTNVHLRVRGVYTTMASTDAYRGAGIPECIYLLERLIDIAADRTGIDRVELRRRNMIRPEQLPWTNAAGHEIDVGDFRATLDRALEIGDWHRFSARREASAKAGKLRGIGLSSYIHGTSGNTHDAGLVRVEADGSVTVVSGAQSSGQGHETVFRTIVAERLEIDPQRVRVIEGDSDLLPTGGGTGGSNAMVVAARSLDLAARKMLDDARRLAARRLECDVADLAYAKGTFSVRGTDLRVDLVELVRWAGSAEELAAEQRGSACTGLARFEGPFRTFPYGTHVCEVEVDPETGAVDVLAFTAVDDVGRVIDARIVEGQVHGGVTQGIAQALHEEVVHDPVTGQLLSGSFMDYALPRADDVPSFKLDRLPIPSTHNPLGMKGVGECGPIGAPAAVVGAVCDALGVAHVDMPLRPERVWRAIRKRAGDGPAG